MAWLRIICANTEDTARSRLCSAARGDLQVPHSKMNFGSRAFAVARPMFWNRLPPEIRANDSLQSFKSQLELDSMLWRLRSQHVIIIIIIITYSLDCSHEVTVLTADHSTIVTVCE